MHEGHRTVIKFFIAKVKFIDLLRNVNKISLLLLLVQNNKSSNPSWQ